MKKDIKQKMIKEFEKEFAFGDEYLCLYNPRTKSYTSVGESVKHCFISHLYELEKAVRKEMSQSKQKLGG